MEQARGVRADAFSSQKGIIVYLGDLENRENFRNNSRNATLVDHINEDVSNLLPQNYLAFNLPNARGPAKQVGMDKNLAERHAKAMMSEEMLPSDKSLLLPHLTKAMQNLSPEIVAFLHDYGIRFYVDPTEYHSTGNFHYGVFFVAHGSKDFNAKGIYVNPKSLTSQGAEYQLPGTLVHELAGHGLDYALAHHPRSPLQDLIPEKDRASGEFSHATVGADFYEQISQQMGNPVDHKTEKLADIPFLPYENSEDALFISHNTLNKSMPEKALPYQFQRERFAEISRMRNGVPHMEYRFPTTQEYVNLNNAIMNIDGMHGGTFQDKSRPITGVPSSADPRLANIYQNFFDAHHLNQQGHIVRSWAEMCFPEHLRRMDRIYKAVTEHVRKEPRLLEKSKNPDWKTPIIQR